MFETITMAKLYLKQGLYADTLEIASRIEEEQHSAEASFIKACSLEGLNRNEEAEKILYTLIDNDEATEGVYGLLEKIYTKTGKSSLQDEDKHQHAGEIAHTYERIGDLENALKYYTLKVEEIRTKLENKDSE